MSTDLLRLLAGPDLARYAAIHALTERPRALPVTVAVECPDCDGCGTALQWDPTLREDREVPCETCHEWGLVMDEGDES